jgi:hypothetical protein
MQIVLCFCFAFLRLVYPMLPVSLNCPFLIALQYFLTFWLIWWTDLMNWIWWTDLMNWIWWTDLMVTNWVYLWDIIRARKRIFATIMANLQIHYRFIKFSSSNQFIKFSSSNQFIKFSSSNQFIKSVHQIQFIKSVHQISSSNQFIKSVHQISSSNSVLLTCNAVVILL